MVVSDIDTLMICHDKVHTFQELTAKFEVSFTITESEKIKLSSNSKPQAWQRW